MALYLDSTVILCSQKFPYTFYISGRVQDYSIIVPPTASREEILARLSEFGGLITSQQDSDIRLQGTLRRLLREKHPIHGQVRKIPFPQLKKLYYQLFTTRRQRPRMETAIVTYFLKKHPHGPLTALQGTLVPLQDLGKEFLKN